MHRVQDSEFPEVYEARYRWTRVSTRLAAGALLCLLSPLLLTFGGRSEVTEAMTAVLAVGGLLAICSQVWNALRGASALRVDAEGVGFGRLPLRPWSRPVLVPWSEITGMEVWTMKQEGLPVRWLGLHRVPGAASLPGTPRRPFSVRANVRYHARSAEVLSAARPAALWELDLARLRAAVAVHAPHLSVDSD